MRWKCELHSLPKQHEQHNNQRRLEEQCVRVMKTAMALTPGRSFRTLPPEIRTEVSEMEDYKEDCEILNTGLLNLPLCYPYNVLKIYMGV